ncbi:MAG: histidinol-phosphatase [Bacteroidales bacterium]|nr:histidinol-phosphatase [Bacteroidales bacterium]
MKANYHTHCTYCDGKDPLSAFVQSAEERHFDQLGFSSHAPVPFENGFAIQESDLTPYCEEIEQLKGQTHLRLFKALECDFIPGMSQPFDHFKTQWNLDYIIGGVHLVRPQNSSELWFIDGPKREIYDEGLEKLFDSNIRKAVTTFWEQTFEMLETEHFDIIAHFDKIKMHNQHRFFQEDEKWYTALADKAVQLIKQKDVIIEINTRGLYKKRCDAFYPATGLLQKARKLDIPVVISSDAHQACEIDAYFAEATTELERCGYGNVVHFDAEHKCFR